MLQQGSGATAAEPRLIPARDVVSTAASFDGVALSWNNAAGQALNVPGFVPPIFNSDGTLTPFIAGSQSALGNRAQTISGGGSGTDNNADRPNLLAGSKRTNAFAYLDYDIAEHFNVYAQGMYSEPGTRSAQSRRHLLPRFRGLPGQSRHHDLRKQRLSAGGSTYTYGEQRHCLVHDGTRRSQRRSRCRIERASGDAHTVGHGRFQDDDRVRWLVQGLEDRRLLPIRQDRRRRGSGRRRSCRSAVDGTGRGSRSRHR